MKAKQFTENAEVFHLTESLKAERKSHPEQFIFSDIVDQNGCQYVDLVQEGGGVLGVALLGYTYVLEQMGIRFASLAGTSAGAINTILMAAADTPDNEKSSKILELLINKDLFDFVDGDSDAKDFIKTYVEGAGFFTMAIKGLQVLDNLKQEMGLNPGDNFLEWLKSTLKSFDIETTGGLLHKMQDFFKTGVRLRHGVDNPNNRARPSLAIIASDLTTETKVEFPRMGDLYFEEPLQVNPACFVRASMSIPLFFAPYRIDKLPASTEALRLWNELAQYNGPIPKSVTMVDGGILSNFPIDVFHARDRIPNRPTFGVKLGLERNKVNAIPNYKKLVFACFDASRQMRDFDFILQNRDYKKLVKNVDIGEHDWLNFNISDDDKVDLFVRGARAAARFLRDFDWQEYKDIRKEQIVKDFKMMYQSADRDMRMAH